jgi:tRNA A-37 threonylcarbamoyl transferase component Bud32
VSKTDKSLRYGKCLVQREIGRGARSIVYLAWHEGLQIPVAVKVMKKEYGRQEEQFSERFVREARIAAQLTHTNIVRVYDCGETDTVYYLVLEYIEGESCRDKMAQWGAFDWQRAVQIMRQVADGLRYAAGKGIIHRDLKPENIMIDPDGDAHLADLGLAKEMLVTGASATADGDVLGTPYYMSPEQVRQPGDVDFRSDLYSLGATLYHMATGEVPFDAPTPFEVMAKHINEELPAPNERRPGLPQRLCDVIMRLMAKAPEDRYADYGGLIRDLDKLLADESLVAQDDGGVMAAVEDEISREPAAPRAAEAAPAPPAPPKESRPGPRPVTKVELPATIQNVRARLLALLALLTFAGLLLGIRHLVQGYGGSAAATVALLAVVLAAAGHAFARLSGPQAAEGEEGGALEDRLSSALSRVCARLDLPTPAVRACRGSDTCYSAGFFSRRGALWIPAEWASKAGLSERETDALLAQGMAAIYSGDSTIRMLLALPVGLLRLNRWAMNFLMRLARGRSAAFKLKLARAGGLVGTVLKCSVIALLFVLFRPAVLPGLLGVTAFILLVLVAAYERQVHFVGDRLASRALGNREAVESLIVATGLAGTETYRLLDDAAPSGVAGDWSGDPVPADVRPRWGEAILAQFCRYEPVPDVLSAARNMFAVTPSAAQRLSRLAGLRHGRRGLRAVLLQVQRLYAGLLDCSPRRLMYTADLAAAGLPAILGLAGAVLCVVMMAVLNLEGPGRRLAAFMAAEALLALTIGFAVTPWVCREVLSPAHVIWGVAVASVSFACSAVVLFSLLPWRGLPGYALMSWAGVIPFAVIATAAAVLYARLSPTLGVESRRSPRALSSKTAHTVAMLMDEDELRQIRPIRPEDQDALAAFRDEPADREPEEAPPQEAEPDAAQQPPEQE